MPKATITIETSDHGNTHISAEFDPPAERNNSTLAEALACVAIKAIVACGAELIAERDAESGGTEQSVADSMPRSNMGVSDADPG